MFCLVEEAAVTRPCVAAVSPNGWWAAFQQDCGQTLSLGCKLMLFWAPLWPMEPIPLSTGVAALCNVLPRVHSPPPMAGPLHSLLFAASPHTHILLSVFTGLFLSWRSRNGALDWTDPSEREMRWGLKHHVINWNLSSFAGAPWELVPWDKVHSWTWACCLLLSSW